MQTLFRKMCLPMLLLLSLVLFHTHPAQAVPAHSPESPNQPNTTKCISDLRTAHIAASVASVLPIPLLSDAADLAEFGINLALKDCEPDLAPPPAKSFAPLPGECSVVVRLPLTRELLDQLLIDRKVYEDLVSDPDLEIPSWIRRELVDAIASEFGHLENQVYGSYSNMYGIALSSSTYGADWGQIGTPGLYHYNSDAQIVLTHPGDRIDRNYVEFPSGNHILMWTADTLISDTDYIYIPDPTNLGPAIKRAAKEGVVTALKRAIKEAIDEAKEEIAEKGLKKYSSRLAKDIAKDVAKEIGKKAKEEVDEISRDQWVSLMLNTYYIDGDLHDVTSRKFQSLYVLDQVPPTISGVNEVTVEALEPGGVSSGAHMARLQGDIVFRDDCAPEVDVTTLTPRFWPLSLQADGSSIPSTVRWTAEDNGAATTTGGVNRTVVTQTVNVVDTKPPILVAPPPIIMEATAGDVMTVSLGSPQVFDVADLRTTVSNDAPKTFTQGVYRINWSAEDRSGNISDATNDTVQILNLKEPGTNVLPTANSLIGAAAIDAISYEPVKITVTGQDGDSQPDPLWFSIENRPENGFFIAPLYPYFIDDYRMAARYSPWIAAKEGEEFAWQVAQSPNAMREYIVQLCEEDIRRTDLPKDFVSGIDYFAADDAGYTYIYDDAYRKCSPGGSTVAPYTTPRISVWDQKGHYVGELERSRGGQPLRSMKFNVGRGTIISTRSDGSSTGTSFVNIAHIQPENAAEPVVDVQFYKLIANDVFVGPNQTARAPEFKNAGAAAFDNTNGVLYVIGDRNQNAKGMVAFKPAPCDNVSNNSGPEDCLDFLGVQVYSTPIVQSTMLAREGFPGLGIDAMRLDRIRDIALDSKGAVHIIAKEPNTSISNAFHRIYKFAPATVNSDGSIKLGEYIGWLGKCDSGPNCDYVNQRSIGFSCTNETCFIDEGGEIFGDRAGQLNNPNALAFDPKGVLYVADSGNSRVQRFSNDGFFAGEARSTGDGTGFVLGDFGSPTNIAVNRGSFYILDSWREIVHIFDAAVIHSIDESSAWVEYQSENNFVGTDRFTFTASDGFRNGDGETLRSPPATVEVNVARNFRPPQAIDGQMVQAEEDTPIQIQLEGYDIDDDPVTFQIERAPRDGTLIADSTDGGTLTYVPDTNFTGDDNFTSVVTDGSGHLNNTSPPATVVISVNAVNDAPVIMPDEAFLRTGIGFPVTFQSSIIDPETDDEHTVKIDWGDGTIENQGEFLQDGTVSGPLIAKNGTITSTLLGYHTYTSMGNFTITAKVEDSAGEGSEVMLPVTVVPMVDLLLARTGSQVVGEGQSTLLYQLVVTNRPPQSGGIPATGITVSETLGEGLSYRNGTSLNGDCTAAGQALNCTLNDIALGASATINVEVAVSSLGLGTIIDNQAQANAAEADPIPGNNQIDYPVTVIHKADFLVDTFKDGIDASPGDGICATAEGTCAIRAAIMEANTFAGEQSISLNDGIYMLNVYEPTEFALTVEPSSEDGSLDGDLDVTDDLVILGLSADRTVLQANGRERVLEVHDGVTVTASDLMLTGGAPLDFGYGGGFRNNGGVVTLRRVSITGNEASSGGGVHNAAGSLTISASSITGNSTVEGGSGGGIANDATLLLENVTISGNRAGGGGGILAQGGNATLRNVTVMGNIADAGGGLNSQGNAIALDNTILAGNSAENGPNCGFEFTSLGHNLVGDLTDCTILGETGSNRVVESFGLSELMRNRRTTYSHDLIAGSKAIDAGRCELETDQRGVGRPQGDDCDIGAVEFVAEEDDDGQVLLPEPGTAPNDQAIYLPMMIR